MKERPIISTGEMVRAILAGRKTQTRRLNGLKEVNRDPGAWRYNGTNINGDHLFFDVHAAISGHRPPDCTLIVKCPYGQPGDRLWVREAFFDHNFDGEKDVEMIEYRASEWERDGGDGGGWSSSIHMPRWASRIVLEITGVRVERLQEITEADALAEGVEPAHFPHGGSTLHPYFHGFRTLWDEINGKRTSWESNPFVWVIEFRRLEI